MDDHRELKYSVVVVIVTINGILLAALGFAAEATVPRIYKFAVILLGPVTYLYGFDFPFFHPGAWLVAMSFYIAGFVMINNQEKEIRLNGFQSYIVCHVVKPMIFAADTSFVFVSVVLEIVYLVATSSRTDKTMNEIE
ncbi:hypothetical protein Tco_1518447 [Tanacetum coccineum]